MKFSIIIPVKNEGEDIIDCVDSFHKANYVKNDCEIIIVDDSSEIEHKKLNFYLNKNKFENISHITGLELGVSGSRNHGAKLAQGEYLIFINADNLAPKDFFDRLNIDLTDKSLDCLSLNNFIENTKNKYGAYLNSYFKKKFFENLYFNRFNEKSYISWTEGYTVKKKKFMECGGFPHLESNKFKAGEDLILGFNLIEANCKGSMSTSAYINHKIPENLREFIHHRFIRGYGVPQIARYYLRNDTFTLSLKTFVRSIFKFLQILSIIPFFFELFIIRKYSREKNFFLKFLPIIFLDKTILFYAELKSFFNILLLNFKEDKIEELKYLKHSNVKNIYVTGAPEKKYSTLKKTLEHIYGNQIKTITLSRNFINYSQTIRVPLEILIFKILYKFGVHYDYTNCSARLVNQIFKSDIEKIILNKGSFINSRTLQFIKKFSPKTKIIYWCEDNMFIKQHYTKNFDYSLKFYDLYYTVDRGKKENSKIKIENKKKLMELPTIYHDEISRGIKFVKYQNEILFKSDEERKIVFIGYYDDERLDYLKFLSDNNISVDVYGNGWKIIDKKELKNISFFEPIYGENYFDKIRNSYINLNFIRKLSKDIINNKTVEVIGSGGFLISEYSDFQNSYFPDKKSAIYFKSKQDLLEKIIYYKNNPQEIIDIKKYNADKLHNSLNLSTLHMYNKLCKML